MGEGDMKFIKVFFVILFVVLLVSCEDKIAKSDNGEVKAKPEKVEKSGADKIKSIYADVIFSTLKSVDNGYVLEANLAFSKDVDKKDVESSVNAVQSGRMLDVSVSGNDESSLFAIKIKGIERDDKNSELIVTVKGKDSLDGAFDEFKMVIPAKSSFEIVKSGIVGDKVSVVFSDRLKNVQNIDGLLRIKDSDFKYSIEDNTLLIYPDNRNADIYEINLSAGIKSEDGKLLGRSTVLKFNRDYGNPYVKFVGDGVIIPSVDNAKVAIEALNINRVQVTAFSVFEDKIGQFFQTNDMKSEADLSYVGRYLWRKTIKLSGNDGSSPKFYELDISELFKKYPNRIIRLTLSFNRGDTSLSCNNEDNPVKEMDLENREDTYDYDEWWKWQNHYGSVDEWNKRNDPCSDSYYIPGRNEGVTVSRNIMVSSIGIMASMGDDGKISITTSDIKKAEPLSSEITVYNFQGGIAGTGKTDGNGFALIDVSTKPYYIKAVYGKDSAYLKVNSNGALPLSTFDVGGAVINKGINGFIYGERDVWRPGDDIHLVFILSDKRNELPDNYPVFMKFFNPDGQLIRKVKYSSKIKNFYKFDLKTAESDMTGSWRVEINAGGSVFSSKISIESIIPNRLFIDLKLPPLYQNKMPADAEISSKWLNGATASGLNAEVNAVLSEKTASFKGYDDYIFSDLLRKGNVPSRELVFSGALDENGKAVFPVSFNHDATPAGFLNVRFESRVYEKSGAFSNSFASAVWYPYSSFIGFNAESSDSRFTIYYTGKNNKVSIAALNADGTKMANGTAKIVLYKLKWQYWWDRSGSDLAAFKTDYSAGRVKELKIPVKNGKAEWSFNIPDKEWGRYILRTCLEDSGHCSSKYLYVDSPYWEGRASGEKGDGASRLELSSDKKVYHPGDTATIYIPFSGNGEAVVTVTSAGSELLRKRLKTTKESTKIEIPITDEMIPGVYAYITLLQPWEGKNNDMPLRLYGVIPLTVENSELSLSPVIKVAETVRPEKEFAFDISEKNGKEAVYTVAVVDEGLLGITNYHVKNPASEFYRKKALLTKFWDMYDYVAGKWSGKIESMLSIGGDSGEEGMETSANERRYPPVVKFYGPFLLKKGEKASHKITIENYNGAVRFMVVMGNNNSYGVSEKTVTVTEPLEILPSVPSASAFNENVTIPLSLFANKKGIKDVTVSLEVKGGKIEGNSVQKVSFNNTGEKVLYFNLVPDDVKNAELTFKAVSGNEKTVKKVYLPLRNLNSLMSRFDSRILKAGEKIEGKFDAKGIDSTRKATVELSTLPLIDFKDRLDHLIVYPHGCVEQTVSSAYPQLYLPLVVKLNADKKKEIDENIIKAIERLKRFQIPSGGFSYWPGDSVASLWGSSYAGEFLLEALASGYAVPDSMITNWRKFQKRMASTWSEEYSSSFDQAYRLYTLALSGKPELSAMNRLKEKKLYSVGRYLLASAYALSGRISTGKELIKVTPVISKYRETDGSFGSDIRDLALILKTETLFKENEKAFKTAVELASRLNKNVYYSTQTTAVTLNAYAKFASVQGLSDKINANITVDGKQELAASESIYVKEYNLAGNKEGNYIIENNSTKNVYLSIVTKSVPLPGEEFSTENGIKIEPLYLNSDNEKVDVSSIKLTDEIAFVYNITNITGRAQHNLALEWRAASGLRILNQRMMDVSLENVDYVDYRDTSVYIYFSLKKGESKQFKVLTSASWPGKYYLPMTAVSSMYDENVYSSLKGFWINIK